MVDPKIITQDSRFMAESEAAEETFAEMEEGELETMHERFVKASGGKLPSASDVKAVKPISERIKKESTFLETKKLLLTLKGIRAAAEARSYTVSTIVGHLEEMVVSGEITKDELEKIAAAENDWKKTKKALFAAIKKHGPEKLKPLYEETEGKYDYHIIRLARLVYGTEEEK
jgi:hypothetical protein